MSSRPKFAMCPVCVLNQDFIATTYAGDSVWIHTCSNPTAHGDSPLSWQETPEGRLDDVEYGGLAEEWGLYDDLRACIVAGEPYVEHGIVEYRYQHRNPVIYRLMVERWGHTVQGKRHYSVSSFLGSTLGRMLHRGDLSHRWGPGSGYWEYDTRISYWAAPDAHPTTQNDSWQEYATRAGLDPEQWYLAPEQWPQARG